MPLSCGCDWGEEPGMLMFFAPFDFEELQTSRRKRCSSCNELIDIGGLVAKFDAYKVAESQIEINIYGEFGEIPRAPRYLCEKCAEIYFNLDNVGFECIFPGEDMRELLREYQRIYKPQKLSV